MHASGRRRDDKKQLQRLQSKMSLPERLIELRALPADLPVLGQTSLRRARCQKTALPSAKRSASEVKMFRHRSRRRRCPPPRLSPADQPTRFFKNGPSAAQGGQAASSRQNAPSLPLWGRSTDARKMEPLFGALQRELTSKCTPCSFASGPRPPFACRPRYQRAPPPWPRRCGPARVTRRRPSEQGS